MDMVAIIKINHPFYPVSLINIETSKTVELVMLSTYVTKNKEIIKEISLIL